jgi:hypothetical protein
MKLFSGILLPAVMAVLFCLEDSVLIEARATPAHIIYKPRSHL